MADVHSKEIRSYNMSRIRAKNTKPEILVRRYLHKKGFRFRLHYSKLPGKPDIVLPKYRLVIFVHGCFWHSHTNCKYAVTPKSNTEWWQSKLRKNFENDLKTRAAIENLGWKVIILWECELKSLTLQSTLHHLSALISNA